MLKKVEALFTLDGQELHEEEMLPMKLRDWEYVHRLLQPDRKRGPHEQICLISRRNKDDERSRSEEEKRSGEKEQIAEEKDDHRN